MKHMWSVVLLCVITLISGITQEEAYQQKIKKKEQVYQRTLRFIERNPNSPDLAKLYFNLGEMSNEIDAANPMTTAQYFKKSYELAPNVLPDIKLYNIGYFLYKGHQREISDLQQRSPELSYNFPIDLRFTLDKVTDSESAFLKIYNNNKDSELYGDVLYRLGTLYFDVAYYEENPTEFYDRASLYFDELANREGDPQQVYGLFHRGWTAFTKANWDTAINDLTKILEIVKTSNNKDYKLNLESTSVELIANSLLNYDESLSEASLAAEKVKQTFASLIDSEYSKEIINQTIELKKTYAAYNQAVDFINAYVYLYPTVKEAPIYIDSVKTIYKNFGKRMTGVTKSSVFDIYERLVNEYDADSQWYLANKTKEISVELEIVRYAFRRVLDRYYNIAYKSISDDSYNKYVELNTAYNKFNEFQADIGYIVELENRKAGLSFLRAEKYNSINYYFVASDLMQKFNDERPENPNFENFEKNSYSAIEKSYALLATKFVEGVYNDLENNYTLTKPGVDSIYIAKANRYIVFVDQYEKNKRKKKEEIVRVLNQLQLVYNEANDIENEYATLERILLLKPKDEETFACYSRMAEIQYEKKNFTEAEDLFVKAEKFANRENKKTMESNIINSIVSQADTLFASQNYEIAINEYKRLVKYYDGKDQNKMMGYQNKMIDAYLKSNQSQQAVDMYVVMAKQFNEENLVLKSYAYAWSLADTLMNDHIQGIRLRKEFIKKYKSSENAFKLELDIISKYTGDPFNDNIEAMEMFLDLYSRSKKMNLGSYKRSDLYIEAIKIAKALGDEDQLIDLYLDFEKKHPKHENATAFLMEVGKIYSQRNDQNKLEDIAKYIYKKDPSINIYVDIQRAKAGELNSEVFAIYEKRSFENRKANKDSLDIAIAKFDDLITKMKENNVKIPELEQVRKTYRDFDKFYNYCNKIEKNISDVKNVYLKQDHNKIVKVNVLTKYKVNLVAGDNRIPNAAKGSLAKAKEFYSILAKAGENDASGYIPIEKKIEVLAYCAKIIEFNTEVINSQFDVFVKRSRQFGKIRQKSPVAAKNAAIKLKREIQAKFIRPMLKNALKYHQLIYKNFSEKYPTNEYVTLATDTLYKYGILKPEKTEMVAYDSTWNTIADSLSNYTISKEITFVTQPKKVEISYTSQDSIKVLFNDVLIANEIVDNNSENKKFKVVILSDKLSSITNEIKFVMNSDVDFTPEILAVYDEAKYVEAKSTEVKTLVTDFSWKTTNQLSEVTNSNDSLWVFADKDKFNILRFEFGSLEKSEAKSIWYPVIDTTKVDEVYFIKQVDINNEIIESNLKFLAQDVASIWINDTLVAENKKLKYDETLKTAIPEVLQNLPLQTGMNTILIKVKGTKMFKGLILEMNYKIRKTNEGGE